jgi:hypothetical protein
MDPACPSGLDRYPSRHAAKNAGWAAADADGTPGLTPSTWKCHLDGCEGFHAAVLTREQVAARLAARGVEATPDAMPRKPRPPGEVEYQNCPVCGSGWGRPHYPDRHELGTPAYTRELRAHDVTVITMFTISIFPMDLMRRSTIRAMMPRGTTISHWFLRSLRWAEGHGYLERGPDWIRVINRTPMVVFSGRRLRGDQELVEQIWLAIAKAAAGLPEEATLEGQRQRELELAALRRLMESRPASGPHGGTGWARVVPPPGR